MSASTGLVPNKANFIESPMPNSFRCIWEYQSKSNPCLLEESFDDDSCNRTDMKDTLGMLMAMDPQKVGNLY